MTGKVKKAEPAAAEPSTGGSLISHEKLKRLYATMLQCRMLSEHAEAVDRVGQEALAVGLLVDALPEDTIAPAHEDALDALITGVPLRKIFRGEMAGNILPPAASPDEQLKAVIAAGMDHKRKKKGVVFSFVKHETLSLTAYDEALKTAAARNLPIVFVVENNPRGRATRAARNGAADFAQKAARHNLLGITVDGNDVVAVYRVAFETLLRARQNAGPMLIEGKTWQVDDSDNRKQRKDQDPLLHMERYLASRKLFTPAWKNEIVDQFSRDLATAAEN